MENQMINDDSIQTEFNNFMHLQLILKEITGILRDKFLADFAKVYKKQWAENNKENFRYFNEFFLNLSKDQQYIIKKGNSQDWDISIFTIIFQSKYFSSSLISSSRFIEIKKIRNLISHNSSLKIQTKEYEEYLKVLLVSLGELNCPAEK